MTPLFQNAQPSQNNTKPQKHVGKAVEGIVDFQLFSNSNSTISVSLLNQNSYSHEIVCVYEQKKLNIFYLCNVYSTDFLLNLPCGTIRNGGGEAKRL